MDSGKPNIEVSLIGILEWISSRAELRIKHNLKLIILKHILIDLITKLILIYRWNNQQ